MNLFNIPIDTLAAGDKQLLQSSENTSGLNVGTIAHFKCKLRLKDGARHVLLGRNGCGKTTLLRAIASGKLDGWPQDLRVHLVDQDAAAEVDSSAFDLVLAANSERLALENEAAELGLLCATCEDADAAEAAAKRLCDIHDVLAETDSEELARCILCGLGFSPEQIVAPMSSLSGGWRVRALIAAALFMKPELLLLDEPTNHLDINAINWLQHYLADEFSGTVLCVSHDRAFINAIADEILIFTEEASLQYFSGNLDDLHKYAEKVARRDDRQDAARQKKIEHIGKKREKLEQQLGKMDSSLTSNIEKKKYGCYQGLGLTNSDKASRRAKKEMKKLDILQLQAEGRAPCDIDPVSLQVVESNDDSWAGSLAPRFQSEDVALKFAFREAEPLNLPKDIPMLQLSGVSFKYTDSEGEVLTNIDLSVAEKDRIAVVGKNGAGKSTLLKLLTGSLAPTSGEITRNHNLRISYFGQHDAEQLQQRGLTPAGYLEECFPKMREHDLSEQLLAFGITRDMMRRPMLELSGGQRMRVAFSRMCAEEPHLLILDEPTNHLDIYAIEALSDALRDFQGAIVFVTHNRHLIEQVAHKTISVNEHCIRFEAASLLEKQRFKLNCLAC
jgi:ATPase subunit of ABC transporter with duplicated ATPase domains